jgi:hypothetical protein
MTEITIQRFKPMRFQNMPDWEVEMLSDWAEEEDSEKLNAWQEIEKQLLADTTPIVMPEAANWQGTHIEEALVPKGFLYYMENYASMEDDSGNEFGIELWQPQREILWVFFVKEGIVPKARRFGVTYILRNINCWEVGLAQGLEGIHNIFVSKDEDASNANIPSCKRIMARWPEWLRPSYAKENESELQLSNRSKGEKFSRLQSFTASPRTARGEGLYRCTSDEVAHHANRVAKSVYAAVSSASKYYTHVSTPNGPATVDGDGQFFAKKIKQGMKNTMLDKPYGKPALVFLASSRHPVYTPEILAEKLEDMGADDFLKEFPNTVDDCLRSSLEGIIIKPSVLKAILAKGEELDKLFATKQLGPPYGGTIQLSIDWGEHTHILVVYKLGYREYYVIKEFVHNSEEITTYASKDISLARLIWKNISVVNYDIGGMGKQLIRVFLNHCSYPGLRAQPIPFGDMKLSAINYFKWLGNNTKSGKQWGYVAISPSGCPELARQLEGWHIEEGKDLPEKGDDHGPDSFVCQIAPDSISWQRESRIKVGLNKQERFENGRNTPKYKG